MNWVFRKAMKPMITTQKRVQGPSLRIIVLPPSSSSSFSSGSSSPRAWALSAGDERGRAAAGAWAHGAPQPLMLLLPQVHIQFR